MEILLIMVAIAIAVIVIKGDAIVKFVKNASTSIQTTIENSVNTKCDNALRSAKHEIANAQDKYQMAAANACKSITNDLTSKLDSIETRFKRLTKDHDTILREHEAFRISMNAMSEHILKSESTIYALTKYIEIVTGKTPIEINENIAKLKEDLATLNAEQLYNNAIKAAAKSTKTVHTTNATAIAKRARQTRKNIDNSAKNTAQAYKSAYDNAKNNNWELVAQEKPNNDK